MNPNDEAGKGGNPNQTVNERDEDQNRTGHGAENKGDGNSNSWGVETNGGGASGNHQTLSASLLGNRTTITILNEFHEVVTGRRHTTVLQPVNERNSESGSVAGSASQEEELIHQKEFPFDELKSSTDRKRTRL